MHFSPRRKSNDACFQAMQCSIESIHCLDLEGLEDYAPGGKMHRETGDPDVSERTTSLKKKLKNNLGIISPRRKSRSKSVPKRQGKEAEMDWKSQVESKASPKKSSTRNRSNTPFRGKSSEPRLKDVEQAPQTPRTPKTPLAKIRSITPFRRNPQSTHKPEQKSSTPGKLDMVNLDEYNNRGRELDTSSHRTKEGRTGAIGALKNTFSKNLSPRRKSTRSSTPFRASHEEQITDKQPLRKENIRKLDDERRPTGSDQTEKNRHSTKLRRPTPAKRSKSEDLSPRLDALKISTRSLHSKDTKSRRKSEDHVKGEAALSKSSQRQKSQRTPVSSSPLPRNRVEGSVRTPSEHLQSDSIHSALQSPQHKGRRTKTPLRCRTPSNRVEKSLEQDEKSTSSDDSMSISSFGHDAGKDLNKSFVQLAISGLEEKIIQVERTPGARPADVAVLASPERKLLSLDLGSDGKTGSRPRSVSMGRGLRSPEKALKNQSLNSSSHKRRSKSTSRASAAASAAAATAAATVLDEAPPTPRSRNRVVDRRTLSDLNDGVSLLSRRTSNSRGVNSKGASMARQSALDLPPMLSVGVRRKVM